MNTFITIATKKSGGCTIIATPDVPYEKQRENFKTFADANYSEIEMWSRSQGKIRSRKIKASAAPVENPKKEIIPTEEKESSRSESEFTVEHQTVEESSKDAETPSEEKKTLSEAEFKPFEPTVETPKEEASKQNGKGGKRRGGK